MSDTKSQILEEVRKIQYRRLRGFEMGKSSDPGIILATAVLNVLPEDQQKIVLSSLRLGSFDK